MTAFDPAVLEWLPGVVLVLDTHGAVVHLNPAGRELVGSELGDVRGRRLPELLTLEEERSRAAGWLGELLAGKAPAPCELSWTPRGGERRVVALSGAVQRGPDGAVERIVLSGSEISGIVAVRESGLMRLRALLEQASDGIFVADLDGYYTEVNDAGCRLLGRTREEIIGKNIVDLIPPEDVERLWAERDELLRGGVRVSDWRLRHADGSFVPVEVSAKILPDGRWQGFVREISERVRLERSLRESHLNLSRAQAVAKVGSWRLDVQRGELVWSEETHHIFGTTSGTAMTYEAFLERTHPDDRAYVEEKWRAALRGEPYDIEHRIVVGSSVKWVREKADLEFDERGALLRGIGVVQDITEQKRLQEEQRLWQEKLNAIVSIARDAIISVDEEHRIVVFNEGAERIFGWSRDEVLGRPLEVLLPPSLRAVHRAHIERFAAEPTDARGMGERGVPLVGLRRSGEEFPAEAAISKIEVAGKPLFTVILRDISERRAIERDRERLLAEIDAERRWLRAMLDIIPMGISFFEPAGRQYSNPRMEGLLGLGPDAADASSGGAYRLLYPNGRPVPPEQGPFERVLRTGETVIGEEYVVERADGSRVPVVASAAPLCDAEGRVVGRIGVLQDISERLRAAEALRLSEERLRVSLQASPAAVFNQDLELRYTWIHNPRPPLTAELVLGRTDFDFLPLEDAERLTRLKRQVVETGVGARTTLGVRLHSEILHYDLTLEPLRDAAGQLVGITGATWDVTDQRRAELEQRLLAQASSVLMASTPDYEVMLAELGALCVQELCDWFMVDLVEDGQVRRLRLAHSDPGQAALARELEQVPLDRSRYHLMFEPLRDGRTALLSDVTPANVEAAAQSEEHLRILRALEIRSLMAVPLFARGRLLGAIALVSSKRAYRYRERDLAFAEELARIVAMAIDNAKLHRATQRAIAAREAVLGIVAHDLRNPLNTIVTQAELLRRNAAREGRPDQRSGEAIRRAALRMNRLIQDILDVARLEAGALAVERSRVVAHELLEEALETQRDEAAKASIELCLEARDTLPDLLGDRDRLLQVFDNLIGNAVKFTPPGGTVTVGATPGAGEVTFFVADTGAGIEAEHMAHLFDRFWQARRSDRRGAGLGLSIARGIVVTHGGRLWVESRLGGGTTFYFTVPAAEAFT